MDTKNTTSLGKQKLSPGHDVADQEPVPQQTFFRHRWLKPLADGRNTVEIVGTEATEGDQDDESEDEKVTDELTNPEDGNVDYERFTTGVKTEDEDTTNDKTSFTESDTPYPNTRDKKLIPWHRDRMAEKLLLCIQYECFQAGINVPFEEAIQRLQASTLKIGAQVLFASRSGTLDL